ncbi:PGC-1 and ERR-induced regulator in muscle protein 1 [Amphiprion ocellaris]|uniref:PGC-1 and ERR-induced regulator in muscle protein 1 n=1 Tax=Amphiprion ocellaris TaxID=80972 RepID=A0A3Q1BAK2_AMPOC|nr:PGC-1 and ERR-induced regulator in muscle protein 1 [Amphiprion ocellaris]XP_035807409.2 PGC-1 and ERR-induced regulator in muscle protein 1 [Amphiprion ocellaris]
MEDFEYSVEICDRDWECFFAECEECNLLPPSLAGVDDSGMSDIDDTGAILAKRAQRAELTAGFSEADRPIDGPPHCEGSPVEHYLSKHSVGGMESVLSGSEEDLHLQSVNIFFERLKSFTEAEQPSEPSQERDGKNREAVQEEQQCSDGQSASRSALPENIPKLNSLPARGEAAVGSETSRPLDTIRNINTMKKVEAESNVSPQPAANNSELKTNKSAAIELFIRDEACTETRVNEVIYQSHDSPDRVVCSETTAHTHTVETCAPLDDVKQEGLLAPLSVDNIKWWEDQTFNVLQSDAASTNKTVSQESSPSASIKRKRRKKRRLSVEQGEGGIGYERQVSFKQSDSEEERYALRRGTGLCLSEDFNPFYANEPQKIPFSPYSAASSSPMGIYAKDVKVNDLSHSAPPCDSQYHYLPENVVRQKRCTARGSAENISTNNRSVTPLSQPDHNLISVPNSSANVATNLQPHSKLQVEELTGLNTYPGSPVSITEGVTASDVTRGNQREDIKAGAVQQSDEMRHSVSGCENDLNLKCSPAQVKSGVHSLLPCVESNAPAVEVSQNDKLSAAMSVLAGEAENSGRDEHTLCQREAEPQQQLETDCHNTDRYSTPLEKTQFSVSATAGIISHALNTKPQQFKTEACPFQHDISSEVTCTNLTSDCIHALSDKSCLSKSPSSFDIDNTVEQTEVQTLSKFDVLSEKNSKAEKAQSAALQMRVLTSNDQTGTTFSPSEDLVASPSDVTHVSSCCTLDTESLMSLSNEGFTDMSASSCSSVSEHDSECQGEKKALILAKHMEEDATSEPRSKPGSECDLLQGRVDDVTASKAESKPEKEVNSVFAMSSFWSEMEKLTINDILGLRMTNKKALPPLQESEESNMFAVTNSGFFTPVDDSKPEQSNEDTSSVLGSVGPSLQFSPSRSVMWESEPVPVRRGADIYPENMMLTSMADTSQAVISERAQKGIRKIYKNVSVQNLHALESESFSYRQKGDTLQTLDEGESEYFSEGFVPKRETDAASLSDTYRISLTDIFQYFFGGKQSVPSQSATDSIPAFYTDGDSVPETYDHFFSEFDTETFFYPLITDEDKAKDKPVPIFSYSRSANRNLQYPEAYDYFFASSSSDDSSVESDDEDNSSPVRVVSRFSRNASSAPISTDIYENFFTDNDVKQNFFWKTTLSFRSINFTASTCQKSTSNSMSPVPVKPSSRSFPRTVSPLNALGNQDATFPDPLLYHLEERISRQLTQQPFRYEDLQTTVSNPRLDASLLPLKQTDMCLVCIAFASWVLKTANPQVGDAWKAVLLANVSALSAIQYLRKYVKVKAAAGETKLHQAALTDS